MSLNKVILVGYVGQDPILRLTASGKAVGKLSVATNARWSDAAGHAHEHTEWHQVVVWGRLAENCHQYLTVGRQVCVEGALQTRKYADKDGQPRTVTEVVAQRVVFLGVGEGVRAAEPEQGRVGEAWEGELGAGEEVPW